jgi:Flp pilus assembly protein TadD
MGEGWELELEGTMQKLEPPDTHYLSAAMGWLELGSRADAVAELAQISPAQQRHPDVLEARWALLAHESRWDDALVAARELLAEAPARSSAWLHHAYALRRAKNGGLQKAWSALLPAATKFPDEPIICFNLACYACQLGNLDEARGWLKRAIKIGERDKIKLMALVDEDLEPLWKEIRKL